MSAKIDSNTETWGSLDVGIIQVTFLADRKKGRAVIW